MMVCRAFIGNNSGAFLFRSSQAGNDALTGDRSKMSAYEDMTPCVPKARGEVTLGPNSSTDVSIPGNVFSYPPFVIVKSTDGLLPGTATVGGWFVAGTTPYVHLFNATGQNRTIRWWAFAEL